MNVKGTKKKNQVLTVNIFEQQEIIAKAEVIKENLQASTWRELETNGKFNKNEKLSFVSDDMLILGCDVGSETHYARAIDTRGRELSKSAFPFSNTLEGFQSMMDWAAKLAAFNDKKQIVLGLEPTVHYWFCLATWLIGNGISVVQVNPYAVKQTKEVEDNSQLKDDRKDPKLIANLVKDGNFGMSYLPEKLYADIRRLSMFRDQLNEDRIRNLNRLHREMKIYFPEYKDAFGKIDGAFCLEVLKVAPFPDDLVALGTEGIRQIWHKAKLRGRGYVNAVSIFENAKKSIGIKDGAESSKLAVKWFVNRIVELDEQLADIEGRLNQMCMDIPYAEKILAISGMGENTLSGILAEMGDGKGAFEFRENSIVVTIPFNRLDLDDTTQVITQVTTQVATQVIERQLNDIEVKILDFCFEPKSTKELAELLEFKERKSVSRYLTVLLREGRIAMTIPNKPNSSKQKYITIK